MALDESLFTWEPKPHDESRYEYREATWAVPRIFLRTSKKKELLQAAEKELTDARKTLPGNNTEWTLAYILVAGNHIDPNTPPLTYTFVFKKPLPDIDAQLQPEDLKAALPNRCNHGQEKEGSMQTSSSDALYLAIGKFLVNWSVFEYEMYLLVKIIYANCQSLIPDKFPDGIAGKIKLVERALSEEPRLSGIADEGRKLINDIWIHLELRHVMVHGSAAYTENSSRVTFFRPLEIGTGPLKEAKHIPVELSQIEKEAQEMEDGSLELGFFSTHFKSALPNRLKPHSP